IDAQLAGTTAGEIMPEGALARLDRLETRLRARRRRLSALRRKRSELRARLAQLRVNDTLCRQARRLGAVAEKKHWMASLEKERAEPEADLASLPAPRREHAQSTTSAGLPILAEPLAQRDLIELRSTAKALRRLARQIKNARQD